MLSKGAVAPALRGTALWSLKTLELAPGALWESFLLKKVSLIGDHGRVNFVSF